ncbi:GNAT family N-acetyltransferase [Aspergillus lucknowensis]|uniref:N-acetyltransferase domain-containing protein n=1 Tax=Aspergillus lucknowensis TaxID=176173 RepID=A0ABR4LS93_9EURO
MSTSAPTIAAETAGLIEAAEIAFITAQIEGACQLFPGHGFRAERVGGGVAAITKPSFGRKLNHVAGFGMGSHVTEKDFEALERICRGVGVPVEINICPFAHPSSAELLAARGYRVCVEISVYFLPLRDYDQPECLPTESREEIRISPVSAEEHDLFLEASVTGFQSAVNEPDLLHTLAGIALRRPDTVLYFARIDGKIAGTAGVAFITTPQGRVAELYIDSTVPEFRGRGVQAALLRERLLEANKRGFEIATVNTWPVGTSARNVERAGFQLAYRKDVYTI